MDFVYESKFREMKITLILIQSNNDLEQIQDKEWTISVINDSSVRNAFFIPAGKLFLFIKILDICDNDEQLAAIIAHEMAHE